MLRTNPADLTSATLNIHGELTDAFGLLAAAICQPMNTSSTRSGLHQRLLVSWEIRLGADGFAPQRSGSKPRLEMIPATMISGRDAVRGRH